MYSISGLLKRTAPCLFAIIIDAMGFGLVYPTMTALFTAAHSPILPADISLHLRQFYLGLSFLLYPLCMFFGTSFMADLSDKYGRKKILAICMAGITLGFLLMGFGVTSASLSLLFIGRALSGFMAGSQPVAQASIADLSSAETKIRNMTIVSMSYCIGVILGPLLGGLLADQKLVSWFNFSTPFYAATLLALIAFIWVAAGFKNTEHTPSLDHKLSLARPITLFIEGVRHQLIRKLALVFLLMQIGFSLFFQFIVVYMRTAFHYLPWQLGAINSMLGIGFGIGLLIGMPLVIKRAKPLTIALYTLLLLAIGQLFAGLLPGASVQWPLAIIIATVDIMCFSSMLTLFSDSVDSKKQGWAMGIANAMMALAWTLTGFASNLLSYLGANGLILLGGIILLIAALYFKQSFAPKFKQYRS